MDALTTSREYLASLDAYWSAQKAFRIQAEKEMRRLIPGGVQSVILELNDTPRLTVSDLLNAAGQSVLEEFDDAAIYEVLDQIASDMEAFTWDEAESFLSRDSSGERFVVERNGEA